MKDFAKIFHHPEYGQVLAHLGQADRELAIVVAIMMPPPLDICFASLLFVSNDRQYAYKLRQKAFDELTIETLLPHLKMLRQNAPQIDPETGRPYATH
jgi:hypothetical protein